MYFLTRVQIQPFMDGQIRACGRFNFFIISFATYMHEKKFLIVLVRVEKG